MQKLTHPSVNKVARRFDFIVTINGIISSFLIEMSEEMTLE